MLQIVYNMLSKSANTLDIIKLAKEEFMPHFQNFFLGRWKKNLVLLAIGLLFSLLIQWISASSRPSFLADTFCTDTLFWIGMSFFISGLFSWVHNAGAFNGLIYGAKCALAVFRGKQKTSRQMIDGYVDYCNGRRRIKGVRQDMVSALLFFVLSVLSNYI